MKRLFHITRHTAFFFTLGALCTLALALSLLRFWFLPAVAEFRGPLETRLASLIGEAVRIDGLSARLHGFHPELAIAGFHILDGEGRSAIDFESVRLDLDAFRTLAAREPRFDRVEIVGPRLSVRRRLDGTLSLLGLAAAQGKTPAWLLADGAIDLLDAEVDWQDVSTGAATLALGRVNLRLRNDGDRHRLSAGFALPENLGRSLRLVLDATGDPFSAGWSGRLYLEGQALVIGSLAAGFPSMAFGLRTGTGEARLWMDWHPALSRIAGEFQLRNPVIGHRTASDIDHRLAMKSLSSRFYWERQPDGWRLDLSRFRPVLGNAWPDTRLAVAVRRQPDGSLASVAATASHLDLTDLGSALDSLALSEGETGKAIRSLAPRGSLGNLRGFHAPAAPAGERWAFCGRFRDLGLMGSGTMPDFSGVHGEVCGSDAAGHAVVDAAPGRLTWTGAGLAEPIALSRLETEFSWRRTEDGLTLTVPSFSAGNHDFSLTSQGRVFIPAAPNDSPYLDLMAQLAGVEAARIYRYLPKVMIPDTTRWLEQALKAGKATRWNLRFRGRLADFPFKKGEGVFESELDFRDLTVRFHPRWPPMTRTQAELRFRGPRMDIVVHRGRIGEGEIIEAQGVVEDMQKDPWMTVTGRVRVGVDAALDYLAGSPLWEIPERIRRHAEAFGNTEFALKLKTPLGATPGEPTVEGTAILHKAGLQFDTADLRVERLEGPLHFTSHGLFAEGLRARFLDEAIDIDVNQDESEILVDVRGRAGIPMLARQFPFGFWRYARGSADYRLGIRVPETEGPGRVPLSLSLNSDLAGIALDLPVPLAKPERSTRRLSVDADLGLPGKVPLRLHYGPDLQARLGFGDESSDYRLQRAEIAFGRSFASFGDPAGVSLRASLDTLNLAEWWRWWGNFPTEPNPDASWRILDLRIGKLAWNDIRLGRFGLNLAREGNAWRGHIDGSYARGAITATAVSVRCNLGRMEIPPRSKTNPAARRAPPPTGGDRGGVDPGDIPSLSIHAKSLVWGGADLGSLDLETERHPRGMVARILTVTGKDHKLEVHGDWIRKADRGAGTRILGRAHIDDLGRFLSDLGYPGQVRDTPADAEFSLDWPGAPYRFAARSATGELKLNLGKGGLLKVEPGLGRVIGVLNLNSLWRRLNLDFSDLFETGLGYDGISGYFRIGGGQALTEGFLIDAVAAKIVASGRVGLVDRELDQVVAVIPHTTAALPIAGALAGGPAVGAAVYVAQKLIGEEVDSITANHYAVQGQWDNPRITRTDRTLPLNILDRAWSGVKNLPVFGNSPGESSP